MSCIPHIKDRHQTNVHGFSVYFPIFNKDRRVEFVQIRIYLVNQKLPQILQCFIGLGDIAVGRTEL